MAVLHVVTPGAGIRRRGPCLVIAKEGQEVQRVPLRGLTDAIIATSVQITTQALAALLHQGAAVTIVTAAGQLLGHVVSPLNSHVDLRRRQYQRLEDPAFALALAREIIDAKLHNQAAVLHRWVRHGSLSASAAEAAMEAIGRARAGLPAADALDPLRGLEGAAARAYWAAFAQTLRDPRWAFAGRRHHPAPDPVNALLSYGYVLLTARMHTAVSALGLDPYAGALHPPHHGRRALALDLIEPFRAPMVDRFVVRLLNLGGLSPEDFHPPAEAGGVYLKEPARREFLRHWEAHVQHEGLADSLHQQAEAMRQAITADPGTFRAWRWSWRP